MAAITSAGTGLWSAPGTATATITANRSLNMLTAYLERHLKGSGK